ncbi:MAG TPA: outer membrane protein assembly factor BamD [Candidatus Angelobacter sp.]|jgi:outer membrane protein assembly factor BamD (BamD/ComL family)
MTSLTRTILALWLALSTATAFSQDKEQGTIISDVDMYVSPDTTAQRLARASRGRNVILVMDRTTLGGKVWAHVLVVVDVNPELQSDRQISGWIPNTFLITTGTRNGDQIIYGEAVDSENQAQQRGGRKGAAQDAMRLYYRLYEYFPSSPLAGEALWRAADIRWQLEKQDVIRRPSAREQDPSMREGMDDRTMKELIKKFPRTKWADMASFDLIDNKLCGSWQGETKCPEKESDLYEKYAREHPQSPKAAEALYNAAWRQAALVDMYKAAHDRDKSEKARKKSQELAQEIATRFADSDWKPQALELMHALQQGIPTYDVETKKPVS